MQGLDYSGNGADAGLFTYVRNGYYEISRIYIFRIPEYGQSNTLRWNEIQSYSRIGSIERTFKRLKDLCHVDRVQSLGPIHCAWTGNKRKSPLSST